MCWAFYEHSTLRVHCYCGRWVPPTSLRCGGWAGIWSCLPKTPRAVLVAATPWCLSWGVGLWLSRNATVVVLHVQKTFISFGLHFHGNWIGVSVLQSVILSWSQPHNGGWHVRTRLWRCRRSQRGQLLRGQAVPFTSASGGAAWGAGLIFSS